VVHNGYSGVDGPAAVGSEFAEACFGTGGSDFGRVQYKVGKLSARIAHAYFPAFDVFRGIGILFVIAAHTPVQSSLLDAIRPIGALGVHMFFALSGFLITFRLLEEFEQTNGIGLPAFYRRRARRILPPALIYLVLLTLLGPGLHVFQTGLQELSASLLFYRNVYQPPMPAAWYTAHFWTLSLEEQFYLFWPSVLVLAGPKRRTTVGLTLGMILSCVLWRIHVQKIDPMANIYRPDLLADHLLWGCLFGLGWRSLEARLSRGVRMWTGLAGIGVATLLIYWQPPYWQPLFALCVAMGFILSADAAQGWAKHLTAFQTLGKASYDCYIWQSLFLPLPLLGLAIPIWQRVPWSYIGIAIVTAGSYLLTFPRRRKVDEVR
jgi:peptidoglycan/LPS O-acetylase OafA/YrhL